MYPGFESQWRKKDFSGKKKKSEELRKENAKSKKVEQKNVSRVEK